MQPAADVFAYAPTSISSIHKHRIFADETNKLYDLIGTRMFQRRWRNSTWSSRAKLRRAKLGRAKRGRGKLGRAKETMLLDKQKPVAR
jgi:hypothetical protein